MRLPAADRVSRIAHDEHFCKYDREIVHFVWRVLYVIVEQIMAARDKIIGKRRRCA